jgi:hypothetical protein
MPAVNGIFGRQRFFLTGSVKALLSRARKYARHHRPILKI